MNVLAISAKAPDADDHADVGLARRGARAHQGALARARSARACARTPILIGLVESGQWVRRAAALGTPLDEFYATTAARAGIPLGRFGRAEEFANLCAFLRLAARLVRDGDRDQPRRRAEPRRLTAGVPSDLPVARDRPRSSRHAGN